MPNYRIIPGLAGNCKNGVLRLAKIINYNRKSSSFIRSIKLAPEEEGVHKVCKVRKVHKVKAKQKQSKSQAKRKVNAK
jgi:hypothetical protein